MARAKKAPRILPDSEKRLSGLKSVDPKLNFGNGISVAALEGKIKQFRDILETYNDKLSGIDATYKEVLAAEAELTALYSKLLAGVGMRYGKDSSEYDRVRGARQSVRRRSTTSQETTTETNPVKNVINNEPKLGINELTEETTAVEVMAQLN